MNRLIHRDLFWRLTVTGTIFVACSVLGGIHLLGSSTPLIAKILLMIIVCMPVFWLLVFRLHLRSLWVYRNTNPVPMTIKLKVEKDSDHASYYVSLKTMKDDKKVDEIQVYPPAWNTDSLNQYRTANVFVDPKSLKPLVIEVDGKRLWSMTIR